MGRVGNVAKVIAALPLMFGGKFDKIFSGPIAPIEIQAPLVPPTRPGAAGAADTNQGPRSEMQLMSWNLLATPYVRPRGSEDEEAGLARAREQISLVAESGADVVGLQEFWCLSQRYVALWEAFASAHGYILHVCPRVNGKADGCALLVRASLCGDTPPEFGAFTFDDWGSRIVQVCRLPGVTVMNTHLTFPHESEHDAPMRYHQARKIAELTREMTTPTLVFGDLNAPDASDAALNVLTSLGGLAPLPPPPDGGSWVSHVAHTGALMPCDLVLTRGGCRVREWRLGGSHAELVSRRWLSDHRPLLATVELGDGALSREQEEEDAPGMH